MEARYSHLNEYLKQKFGERVLKISIDGGFSCPNRDGKCGIGGCVFCDEFGSGKQREQKSISEQINAHLNSYRGQRANKFIAYFQNFSNTYDSVENLKKKYDEAVNASNKIIGLSIATRPDCINDEIAKLIASYKEKYYVQVELGLQTSNDSTAKLINRGYSKEIFSQAVKILNRYNIDIVVHIMIGLPDETQKDLENTIEFINKHRINGIKIHSTYVVKNTKLCKMFEEKKYFPITLEEYLESAIYVITHIRKNVIIHRISGDAPKQNLVAPTWNAHKKLVLNGVEKLLKERSLYQGIFFKENFNDKV